MRSILYFVIFVSLLQGLHCAEWSDTSPQDGDVIYACAKEIATLPWKYNLSSGDVLGDIQWFYNGSSQEMIAVSSQGQFDPLPAFANRVKTVDNAGIIVSHLTVADSGFYSVKVNINDDSGAHSILHRSVFVQISDRLMTQDGHVHVTQRSEPVLDPKTNQWAIQLQCGTFTFLGHPPYQVEWTTPSGVVVSSSDFNDHHFNLLLTRPVQGGNYTCRIPPQLAFDACIRGNDVGHVQASADVDKVDARLSLLEKENEQLKSENNLLKEQLTQSHLNLSHQLQNLQHTKVDDLQTQVQGLGQVQSVEQAKVADLQSRTERLEDRTRQQIGFHAIGLRSETPRANTPLIVNNVHYNYGNAYNGATGFFTAPLPGLYFFVATTGSDWSGHGSGHHLYVDQYPQTEAWTHVDSSGSYSMGTVHVMAHLNRGQRVWIRSGGYAYWPYMTTFSGFLFSPDP